MLADLLSLDLFKFLLVFTRLGTTIMFLPGFAGAILSARIRLILALALTLVVAPVIAPILPDMPANPADLVLLLLGEATIGVFLGMVAQFLLVALSFAGTFMAFQAGMTNAFIQDPITEQQGSLLPSFLMNVALVLIFATDLHHLMLRAATGSYALFIPGQPLAMGDFADSLTHTLGRAFLLGMQLAGPLVVFAVIFNTGLGLMSRLMPQMQVYFVAIPVQVMVGIGMLALTLPPLMAWFLRFFEDGLLPFVGGR